MKTHMISDLEYVLPSQNVILYRYGAIWSIIRHVMLIKINMQGTEMLSFPYRKWCWCTKR